MMSRLSQAHTDGSGGTDTVQQPFPMTRLPLEIQLRIIARCLVSKTPVVNLGTKDWHWYDEEEKKSYPRAQDHLTLNILRTCRTYHDEGWKCFWRENVFLYNSPEALAEAMVSTRDSSRVSSLNMLRHLSVRVGGGTSLRTSDIASDSMILTLVRCLQDCWLFSALDRLQIDFVVPEVASESGYTSSMTQDRDATLLSLRVYMRQLIEASRVYAERQRDYPNSAAVANGIGSVTWAQSRYANFGGPIQEIVITGLPEKDEYKLEVLALRLISTTIMPHGRVGFGRGAEGRRYWYERNRYDCLEILERKPDIKWIAAEGIEEWITTHGIHDASSAQSWSSLFLYFDSSNPLFKVLR